MTEASPETASAGDAGSVARPPVSGTPILAGAALLLAVMLFARRWEVNHDVALYLHCGKLLLQGRLPYVDFLDLNPPLIMYLSALPSMLAGLLSIHVIPAFHLLIFALVVYSAWMSRRFLDRSGLGLPRAEADLMALLVLLFAVYAARMPGKLVGQREALFVFAHAPFFLARWIVWSGGRVAVLPASISGLLAGVAACLKPHLAALAVIIELVQLVRHRRVGPLLRPEAAVFVLTGLAYVAHFGLLPAAMREAFFGRWLPLVSEGYAAYNMPWSVVFLKAELAVGVLLAAAGLFAARGRANLQAGQARLWAVYTAGAVLIYLVQHKGWNYHRMPLLFGALATALAGLCALAADRGAPQFRITKPREAWMIAGGMAAAAMILLQPSLNDGLRPWKDAGMGRIIQRLTPEGSSLVMVSTSVGKIYPLLLQAERESGSRYLWTFPIPMLYAGVEGTNDGPFPYRAREAMGPEERRFLEELGADIARHRPALVLIDAYEKPQGCPEGFTVPAYLEAAGFVAREMAEYRYWNQAFGWRIYVPASSGRIRESGDESG